MVAILNGLENPINTGHDRFKNSFDQISKSAKMFLRSAFLLAAAIAACVSCQPIESIEAPKGGGLTKQTSLFFFSGTPSKHDDATSKAGAESGEEEGIVSFLTLLLLTSINESLESVNNTTPMTPISGENSNSAPCSEYGDFFSYDVNQTSREVSPEEQQELLAYALSKLFNSDSCGSSEEEFGSDISARLSNFKRTLKTDASQLERTQEMIAKMISQAKNDGKSSEEDAFLDTFAYRDDSGKKVGSVEDARIPEYDDEDDKDTFRAHRDDSGKKVGSVEDTRIPEYDDEDDEDTFAYRDEHGSIKFRTDEDLNEFNPYLDTFAYRDENGMINMTHSTPKIDSDEDPDTFAYRDDEGRFIGYFRGFH